jgi:hypothetical protein
MNAEVWDKEEREGEVKQLVRLYLHLWTGSYRPMASYYSC